MRPFNPPRTVANSVGLNGAGERYNFILIGGRSVGATSNGNGAASAAPRGEYNGSGNNGAQTNGFLANGAHSTNGLHAKGIHKNGLSAAPKDRVTDVAVVGYGNWGSKHVRVFSSMPDVKVTVVDSDPLRLASAKSAFPMVELDECLDRALETADVVVVATPPGSHAPIAHAAIRAGCHVLVEKPLATSVIECEDLIDAARLNGVHLMVGHTFEHDATIWKLREIVQSGILGDVRYIDWNVTARLQSPYVRVYNEDREITAWFLLDLTPSVDFGSQVNKRSVSAEFVAVLARLLTRHGNRIGAVFYGDQVDTVIPARTGRRQALHILHRMLSRPDASRSSETDLGELLRTGFRVIPRRSLVFIVSDFITVPGWTKPLAHLAQRHEVIAVRLFDPLEMDLPDLGFVLMRDAETGEQLFVDTHDRSFRRRFAALAATHEQDLRFAFGQAGVDALELSTNDSLVDAILRFADLRKRRRQLAAGATLARSSRGSYDISLA